MCSRVHVETAFVASCVEFRMSKLGIDVSCLYNGCYYEDGVILEVSERYFDTVIEFLDSHKLAYHIEG